MNSLAVRFGEAVKALRESRGWTQNKLAIDAGVQQPTLQRIEAEPDTDPKLSNAVKIARALGVTVDSLLGDELTLPTTPSDEAESRLPGELREVIARLRAQIRENHTIALRAEAKADEAKRLAQPRGRRTA